MHRNTDRMEMNDYDIKSRLFGDISNSVVLELFYRYAVLANRNFMV